MSSSVQLLFFLVFSRLLASAVSVVPQTLHSKTPAALSAASGPEQRHATPTVVAVAASGSTEELSSLVRTEQAQAGTEAQQITAEVGHEGWPRVPRWNAWRGTTTPKDRTPAVDCVWAEWQWWGKCNQTCGGGNKWRQRKIKTDVRGDGAECTGHSKETKKCNTDACPPGVQQPGVQHAVVGAAPRKAGVGPAAIPLQPAAAPAQKKFYQKKSTMFMVAALLLMIAGGATYKHVQEQEKETAAAQGQGQGGAAGRPCQTWEGEGSDDGGEGEYDIGGGGGGGGMDAGEPKKKGPRKSIWNFSKSFSQRLDVIEKPNRRPRGGGD